MAWYEAATGEPKHFSFFRANVRAFRNSGGSIYLLDPNNKEDAFHLIKINTSVAKQRYNAGTLLNQSASVLENRYNYPHDTDDDSYDFAEKQHNKISRIYHGLDYMQINVDDRENMKYLVAKNSNNQPTSVLSFYKYSDWISKGKNKNTIEINALGSNGNMKGDATSLEYALAHIAATENKKVHSQYVTDAIDYHQNIGRKLNKNKYEFSSVWTVPDCKEIADLRLFPKSITKDWVSE